MNLTPQQLEWIVAEVVRRLRLVDAPQAAPQPAVSEVVIADKLVTLRSLEGRLGNTKRLVVAGRAVVTPAVKDELKKHQIELIRQSSP